MARPPSGRSGASATVTKADGMPGVSLLRWRSSHASLLTLLSKHNRDVASNATMYPRTRLAFPFGGDMVSTVRVEAPEASRDPRNLVKEPGTTISAEDNFALAA